MSEEDPKIIIDDDWKSQVEKEKEQLLIIERLITLQTRSLGSQ